MGITIKTADTYEDCRVISEIAHEVWTQHYEGIISKEQIAYMLEKYQSAPAIYEAVQKDHKYYMALDNGMPAGYCGIQYQQECIFLSKIYIKKENRGRGIAREIFNEILKEAKSAGAKYIWLTVNMKNTDSVAIYKKLGFYIDRQETEDIGSGYEKCDYIMRFDIAN